MNPRVITVPDVLRALRDAVAAKGQAYTQPVCRHFDDGGSPICIAGDSLYRLGVRVEDTFDPSVGHPTSSADDRLQRVLEINGWRVTDGALSVLRAAQREADRTDAYDAQTDTSTYTPWGIALRAAEQRAALYAGNRDE